MFEIGWQVLSRLARCLLPDFLHLLVLKVYAKLSVIVIYSN
jgi:hypothetical protein